MLYRGSQHVKWSLAAPGGAALTTPEGDDEKKQAVKTDSLSASKMYSNAQPNQQCKQSKEYLGNTQGMSKEYLRDASRIPKEYLRNIREISKEYQRSI